MASHFVLLIYDVVGATIKEVHSIALHMTDPCSILDISYIPLSLRGYSWWALGTICDAEIEPRSAMFKANALPFMVSLWPLRSD